MALLYILASFAIAFVLRLIFRLDLESTTLLAIVVYLGVLIALRPASITYTFLGAADPDSNRAGAVLTMAFCAVGMTGLLGWRLVAIHQARGLCRAEVTRAPSTHDRTIAGLRLVAIPLSNKMRCSELLSDDW